jgi:hypothetical protein
MAASRSSTGMAARELPSSPACASPTCSSPTTSSKPTPWAPSNRVSLLSTTLAFSSRIGLSWSLSSPSQVLPRLPPIAATGNMVGKKEEPGQVLRKTGLLHDNWQPSGDFSDLKTDLKGVPLPTALFRETLGPRRDSRRLALGPGWQGHSLAYDDSDRDQVIVGIGEQGRAGVLLGPRDKPFHDVIFSTFY